MALPVAAQCSHGVGVTPAGVEQQPVTDRRLARPVLHPWPRGHLGARADRLAMRGKRASARLDATPSELALTASAGACGSPDAGLRSPGASAAVYIGKPRILHASNLARRAVSSFGAHAPYWAIPAAPRSGRLTVEVRGPIFGFAVGDRLLAAQALDVEQAPTAMVVDCSFAWGSASPLDAGRPTTER
jgi:hypothetical protein